MTSFADTFVTDLAFGFAQLVGDAGIGFTWDDGAGDYTADQVGIFVADVPDVPDRLLVVTPYPLTADPTLSNSVWGVQFRYRGRPGAGWTDVSAMSGTLRAFLLGFYPLTLPTGVRVAALTYANGASLGQDDRRRWQWQDSFTAVVSEPGSHR